MKSTRASIRFNTLCLGKQKRVRKISLFLFPLKNAFSIYTVVFLGEKKNKHLNLCPGKWLLIIFVAIEVTFKLIFAKYYSTQNNEDRAILSETEGMKSSKRVHLNFTSFISFHGFWVYGPNGLLTVVRSAVLVYLFIAPILLSYPAR